MNLGVIFIALLLVAGCSLAVIAIAGAPHDPYGDTYGDSTSAATNNTQSVVTEASAPLSGVTGGLVLLLGFFAVVITLLFLSGALKPGMYGQGRR